MKSRCRAKRILFLMFIGLFALAAVNCGKEKPADKPLETGTAAKGDQGYTFKVAADKMQLQWSLAGETLTVKLKAPTSGWVGVGFNPTDSMKDANFVMGLVKEGKVTVSSQYGTAKNLHKNVTDLGGKSYVTNAAGKEENNETEISFSMPLKSGDSLDRPITANADTVVLLAYGPGDILAQQHVYRARLKINLSTGAYTLMASAKQ
ncbi:MAG: DOMON domain-containing protein [Spirochaetes bacterium]|nr:MAG: DOMON domain-containing protein [Spirochaetota bacterium]